MANPQEPDWASRPVDADYLIDSGMLFEFNRLFLHPLGIGLVFRVDKDGAKTFGFKDMRAAPEKMLFDNVTLEAGRRKFCRFMKAFGARQMALRDRRLGQSSQPVCPTWQ